jgi:hypothetical protein
MRRAYFSSAPCLIPIETAKKRMTVSNADKDGKEVDGSLISAGWM